MRIGRLAAVAAVVVLSLVAVTGCSALDPPESKASVETSSNARPGQVTIDTPNGTVNLGGEAGKVPPGFPKDLPLYTTGVASGSVVSVPGGSGYSVQMVTPDSVAATLKSYADKLTTAGFTIVSKGTVKVNKVDQAFITFSKGTSKGLVRITADTAANGGKTKITVQVTVPKS